MIIGISGFKGAGKDTVANIFIEHGYVKISSATPLKDIVAILFSWNRKMLEGDTEESRIWREKPSPDWQWLAGSGIFKEDKYISPRIALQRIGTDLFRNQLHQDIWQICLKRYIEQIKKEKNPIGFVIADARFTNELSMCDHTIQVIRSSYSPSEIQNMPISETQHLEHNFDTIIFNKNSISSLRDKVIKLIQSFK